MKRLLWFVLAVLATAALLPAQLPQVKVGTWNGSGRELYT